MKCPNCSGIVREVDTLDSEYFGNKYYDTVEGICSKCGKIWRWKEVYTFDHYEDIEGIEIDGHL